MALDSYSGLKTSIANWLGRSDLTAEIDDFIDLFETEFNRKLKTQEMKTNVTITTSSTTAFATLPTDFRRIENLSFNTDARNIEFVTQKQLKQTKSGESSKVGRPTVYALAASSSQGGAERIEFGPAPDSDYVMTLEYSRSLTPLSSSATSNWLLNEHPGAYLYGSLKQALTFITDSDRRLEIKSGYDEIIADIKVDDFEKKAGGAGFRIVTDIGNQ